MSRPRFLFHVWSAGQKSAFCKWGKCDARVILVLSLLKPVMQFAVVGFGLLTGGLWGTILSKLLWNNMCCEKHYTKKLNENKGCLNLNAFLEATPDCLPETILRFQNSFVSYILHCGRNLGQCISLSLLKRSLHLMRSHCWSHGSWMSFLQCTLLTALYREPC